MKDVLLDELKNFLRPEFLNRIDDIVVFRPLSKQIDLRSIVDVSCGASKLLVDRELKVELTDAAEDATRGHRLRASVGARPLKRAILKEVQDPLAEEILRGGYVPEAS